MTNSNGIKIDGGFWIPLGSLGDYPLSRLHSETYEHGIMYQIRFAGATLQLTPEAAEELDRCLHATVHDDMHKHAMGRL